jgi:hypothetical protein
MRFVIEAVQGLWFLIGPSTPWHNPNRQPSGFPAWKCSCRVKADSSMLTNATIRLFSTRHLGDAEDRPLSSFSGGAYTMLIDHPATAIAGFEQQAHP